MEKKNYVKACAWQDVENKPNLQQPKSKKKRESREASHHNRIKTVLLKVANRARLNAIGR